MPSVTRPGTPFIDAVDELIASIERSIPASYTGRLDAFLVGGVAVHVHTGWRVSKDMDIHFQKRIIIPPGLKKIYVDEGQTRSVAYDYNYGSFIALLHPDCWEDAWDGWSVGRIDVKVLSTTDLCVSKIGRWQGNDAEDVCSLAAKGLLDAAIVEHRFLEALDYYVGDTTMLQYNLRDALEEIARCSPAVPRA